MVARLTVVRDDDDLESIERRLSGGDVAIDGFIVEALVRAGIPSATLRSAILTHSARADRRTPVDLPYPAGWALHGDLVGGRFEIDRLEMDDVVWFGRGSAGMPHVAIRRSVGNLTEDEVLRTPLGVLTGRGGGLPTVRSVQRSPQNWLYLDVDPVPASI
jgi:hypothetical protein